MRLIGKVGLCVLLLLGLTVGFTASASAQKKLTGRVRQPKVSILMLGDSVALTLGYELDHEPATSRYDYSLADWGLVGCGVAMGPATMSDGKSDPEPSQCDGRTPAPGTPLVDQPWPTVWRAELLKYRPNVVVLLAGRWEEVDRVYNGEWTNILNPTFAAYVKQQLELASILVTSTGANLVFMTAPCDNAQTQLDGMPWPENDPNRLAVYNELVREVAAEFPTTDSVFDLDGLVCPGGRYSATYRGQTIRDLDGVHFAESAGLTLAPQLMPPIVAVGRAQIARSAKQTAKQTAQQTAQQTAKQKKP